VSAFSLLPSHVRTPGVLRPHEGEDARRHDDRPGNEVRLATTVGQPHLRPLGGGRYVMPDGTTRFLVDHEQLLNVTKGLGGSLLDPLKSTVVHEQRSMGTWVVRKRER